MKQKYLARSENGSEQRFVASHKLSVEEKRELKVTLTRLKRELKKGEQAPALTCRYASVDGVTR